ncbi:Qnr family pentapeptide repeat protein [Photobacterium sp. SDRW27]|uniref:Qnr family pentapeptide repeat protein n=1 Tax=Photobacterium obscurum TaxID=2829490 RepID=UPI0022444DAF|nr:Qnr family pentapeptide repeat protein [Photobacterium obscurum]MCW8329903.1 Qnr family pentapeptide repeat protein [Photobacterium obscurum]
MIVSDKTFIEENFSKHDLSGSEFKQCSFYRCNFDRADLTDAEFQDCKFIEHGDIEGCSFEYTKLKNASFKECDLSMAQFVGAQCFGIEFRTCNLKGANFNLTNFCNYITQNTFFCSVYITGCNLAYANFENQRLEKCDLFENRWNGANMYGASLKGSDLSRGEFSEEQWGQFDVEECNLCHVDLTGLDPRNVKLKGVMICDWQQEQLLEPFGLIVSPG